MEMFNAIANSEINTEVNSTKPEGNAQQVIAPRPRTIEETGLSIQFLADLLVKHIYDGGVLNIAQLAERCALAGTVIEVVLDFLRKEGRVEVRGQEEITGGLRYALTDRGRASALDALLRSGYTGPAPVPLNDYIRVVEAHSVHDVVVTREAMLQQFADVVIRDEKLNQLGPALHSGRAIFIYGPAGTGKTYITQRLINLLPDEVLIPYAVSVNETVVQLFDPQLHKVCDEADKMPSHLLGQGHDPRFVRCYRPVIVSGGELTLDMLELNYNPATKEYQAPLQMKANNGIFIIDDLGRQRVAPVDLLNRWIVPMEEKKDYLSFGAGCQFSVPFNNVLVFSTNINPLELADEAFLRRIGYKIHFDYLSADEYKRIWQQECEKAEIDFDEDVLNFLVHELHYKKQVPLLPCHPRDILNIALNMGSYQGDADSVTIERVSAAWDTYFVQLEETL
jgi:hypothetical protein